MDLTRSPGGRAPRFGGAHALVHDRVRREMFAVYQDRSIPPFLDAPARNMLAEARKSFARYRLDERSILDWGADTLLFLWAGDRVMSTVGVALAARGLEVSLDGLALTVSGTDPHQLRRHLEAMVAAGPPDPALLAATVENKETEKYDWVLKGKLLNAAYAARSLDPEGAWHALRQALERQAVGDAVDIIAAARNAPRLRGAEGTE